MLKKLKVEIKKLHSQGFKNVKQKVINSREELMNLHSVVSSSPADGDLKLAEIEAVKSLMFQLAIECSILRQKIRVYRFKEVDTNSKFFHAMLKDRKSYNRIETTD